MDIIIPALWYAIQLHRQVITTSSAVGSVIIESRSKAAVHPQWRSARSAWNHPYIRNAIAHKLAKIVAQTLFAEEFSRLRKPFKMNDDRRPTVDLDGAMRAGRISLILASSSFSPAEATPDEPWLQKNARSWPREIASNRAPRAHFLQNK
jgi:hypothetical protein